MKKITLIICMLVSIASFAQKKNKLTKPTDPFAGLDTTFEKLLKDFHAAGFAVAVVEKNKIIYAKGFGYRDVEKKLPVTPNTLFAIGSCTKAFTASQIGLLVKNNKIEYDKPAKNYLAELNFYNNDMNRLITVRDLMCHRTGLPRHDYSWYLFPSSSRDSLVKRIQYQEPTAGIREKWQYNNFMFLVQGVITEKLTGNSWETNVKENIFNKLGMNRSNFSVKQMEKDSDASVGYTVKKDSIIKKLDYYNIDAMGPAGSINSSVNEMANWVITWINGGKFKGTEILPAAYVTEAQSSQMVIGAALPTKDHPDVQFSTYGFGWMLASYRGHYRVEHGGNIDGFSASTCFFPSDSIGIIVLTNQNGSSVPSIVRNTIADRLLHLSPFAWSDSLKAAADKAIKATKEALELAKTSGNQKLNTHPSHSLKDYEGLYNNLGYGTIDVYTKNDSLFMKIDKDDLWLKHYHYDIFQPFGIDKQDGIDTTEASALRIAFTMNDAGDIDALHAQLEAGLEPLKFIRKPKPKTISVNELKKYIGEYELTPTVSVKVYIKDDKLFVFVPGQPEYELVNTDTNLFALKILNGYFVEFNIEKEVVTSLTFKQPNGNFKAKKK
ncbi:MAG: serine hydrolase [Bacteroidetes bacterium]|nr:serine hydrolase [Bacteroidota bacterium]